MFNREDDSEPSCVRGESLATTLVPSNGEDCSISGAPFLIRDTSFYVMPNIQASLIDVCSLPCMFLKTASQRNFILTLPMRLHDCCGHIQAGFKPRHI